MIDFKFTGPKLDDIDLPRIGHDIGVGEDIVHAILDTETGGSSTDSEGRLKALYEPHKAYAYAPNAVIRNKLIKAGLAYKSWGQQPYPRSSYDRIGKAYAIDPTTALLSTSWGFPQIMGSNFALAGYDSVEEMVEDFTKDEDRQLQAMINFIKGAKLDDELRVLEAKIKAGKPVTPDDCRAFVRGYNGAGYEKNNYHTTFAKHLNRWIKIPDTAWTATEEPVGIDPEVNLYDGKVHPEVLSVQQKLNDLGYPEVGTIDGKWGSKTRASVLAFRADNGLALEPVIDNALLTALMVAKPRVIAEARANATIEDLRKDGATDVKAADFTQTVGGLVAAGGVLSAATKALDAGEQYSDLIKRGMAIIDPFREMIGDNLWIIALAVGGVIIWKTGVLKNIRLYKHQTGQDVSE